MKSLRVALIIPLVLSLMFSINNINILALEENREDVD